MARRRTFIESILSTQKQRQRFYYFRNLTALCCAVGGFHFAAQHFAWAAAIVGLFAGYLIIGPVVAFLVCLIEQMYS